MEKGSPSFEKLIFYPFKKVSPLEGEGGGGGRSTRYIYHFLVFSMYWSVLNKKRIGYVWAVEIFFIIGKIYFKLKFWYIKGYLLNGIINNILWQHFWNKLGGTMQLCIKYDIEIGVTFTYWFFIIWKIYFKLKFW